MDFKVHAGLLEDGDSYSTMMKEKLLTNATHLLEVSKLTIIQFYTQYEHYYESWAYFRFKEALTFKKDKEFPTKYYDKKLT